MTVRDLREKFLSFFVSKNHALFPSASLVPFDVTGRLDESLLFTGAGMVQFKPYFRGSAEPSNPRLCSCQKCVRTGDIEEVGDLSHLTFFEMLGNFSFGDYFKEQAIDYSWEFLFSPEWLALDPARVCCTVFEQDDEAFAIWAARWESAGFDPLLKVFRLGEETNYWPPGSFSSGPPGPCGPNSEMFYWTPSDEAPPKAPYSPEDFARDEAVGRWLEIWNDVFVLYEWKGELKDPNRPALGYSKLGLDPLPFQSVDTGMGVERTITALNSRRSVYENDSFEPIMDTLRKLSGRSYGGTDDPQDVAMRIIADHIRTAVFCIADGVLPGNVGRGYVLRRLIRRAVLKGQRSLGIQNPFFHLVYDGLAAAMAGHYHELKDRRDTITESLKNEEQLFRRTVQAGSLMLQDELASLKGVTLPGDLAFRLYDTYGFPLEVTQEICSEAGIGVDLDGYQLAMSEAQERSRKADSRETVYGGVGARIDFGDQCPAPTAFLGYDTLETDSVVVAAIGGPYPGSLILALDKTPFYTESGGQVSDTGSLEFRELGLEMAVDDITRQDGVVAHVCRVKGPQERPVSELATSLKWTKVFAKVDAKRRRSIMRNHTATHLLHAALRETLGKHVTQAGSYVGPDHLRFDFTHGKAMSAEELTAVERIVNDRIFENTQVVIHVDMPIAEARAAGAMALFGEKYGDKVRMVQIGDFSCELCGGAHVRSVGEIGLFKIVGEASAASGIRRVEALTGEGSFIWATEMDERMKSAAALFKTTPRDLVLAIQKAQEHTKDLQKRYEKLRDQGAGSDEAKIVQLGAFELAVQRLDDAEPRSASLVADRLADGKPARVVIVGSSFEGKVTFVAKVGPQALQAGANAGALVRDIARIAGGGGGGRPDFATAGGKLPEKLSEALAAAIPLLKASLGL